MQRMDGMNYAPVGKARRVCEPGQFNVAVIGLDHGHINGMCNGLVEAGAEVVKVFDRDEGKVRRFREAFPSSVAAASEQEIYDDKNVDLVACASIPSVRAEIGINALLAGKHVFVDKPAMTTFEQLHRVREAVQRSKKRFAVYFSERLHVEAATYADQLIADGMIGTVVQTIVLGPHRLNAPSRPQWFFEKEKYGGIITDIGSHQIEQILHYNAAKDATVLRSSVANYNTVSYPEFEDFGDGTLVCDNGTTGYFRVDWFTPDGLGAWGDGRTIILGTKGYIELRKYLDLGRENTPNNVYMANTEGEFRFDANNTVGFPFFGAFIQDCLEGTEHAIGQAYTIRVMELALEAQATAARLRYVEEKQ